MKYEIKINLAVEVRKTSTPKKKSPAQPKPTLSQSLKNTIIINHK